MSTSRKKAPSENGKAPQKGDRITIKTVAEAAEVSIATVSFVLNDRKGQAISEPVKKRVLAAAKRLGYAPSASAAGLARKKTRNVMIVFYNDHDMITNQFYSFVVQGAIKEAVQKEYNLLFSFLSGKYNGFADLPKAIREKNAEGLLFIRDVPESLTRDLETLGVALVVVDSHQALPRVSSLSTDSRQGAKLAVDHLVGLGHTEIAFLGPLASHSSIQERLQGFEEALRSHDLRPSPKRFWQAEEITFQSAYERSLSALRKLGQVTAVFCANDEMAAGLLRAAHECDLCVPSDLSVIGFDDIIMSTYLDPPLTTVSVNKEALGRRAMLRLLELVADPDSGARRESLGVELILRGSTGRAPRSKC